MELNETFLKETKEIIASLPCDYAEMRMSSGSATGISLSGEQVDSVSSGFSMSGSVRVYYKGAWGFVSFNDPGELKDMCEKALNLAKKIRSTESGLSLSKPFSLRISTSVNIDPSRVTLEEKFNTISKYNRILRSHDKIQTTRASYSDASTRRLYVNSEGTDVMYDRCHTGFSLTAFAKEGIDIQTHHFSDAGYCGFEILKDRENDADDTVRTAVEMLSAGVIDGGTYDVILDPRLAGVFVHEAFGHLSEADFVYENPKMLAKMKIGEVFGPDILNIIDDGSIQTSGGYIPVDDEGIVPRRNYLVKNGLLAGRLHSRETACKMKEEVTGNARAISPGYEPIVRMTNTFIDNGNNRVSDLFNSVEDGIYAVNYHGGQTNLEMFTFSAGTAYEIKKGKKGRMLKNVMLSGNVFETLKNVRMVADDMKLFSSLGGCGKGGQSPLPVSLGGPHVLVGKILIGGKQK